MKNKYVQEFYANIKFAELLMRPLQQRIWNTDNPTSVLGWLINLWPIWYITLWVSIYTYFIFSQRAGLAIVAEQVWCLMSVTQILAKLVNGVLKKHSLKRLMQWCEEIYAMDYKDQYQPLVHGVFEKTNIFIYLCTR